MGNRYVVKLQGTPTDAQDFITIVSAANRRVRICEVSVGGAGTTSAAQRLRVCRSSGGTTGGGALTPDKFDHAEQPAASGSVTVNTTWSGQPTAETHGKVMTWNALGGANNWIPPKGAGIEARNGENISIRADAAAAFQACSVSVIFEVD